MRKILSVWLALVLVLTSVIAVPLTGFADESGRAEVREIELNKTYKDTASVYYRHTYEFVVPSDGVVTFQLESKQKYYFWGTFSVYNEADKLVWQGYRMDFDYSNSRGVYYASNDIPLDAGTYYLTTLTNKYDTIFTIRLAYDLGIPAPVLGSMKAGSHSIIAEWDKVSGVSGYELQYSTNRKFTASSTETVKIKKAENTRKKIGKLKQNKNYYVRVRGYKSKSGSVFRTGWSSTKRVRTK